MSIQIFRTAPDAPDFDEVTDTNYEHVADVSYDEAIDPSYDEGIDPDYDEGSQGEFADDFTEPEHEETGQVYRPHKQK